MLKSTTNPDGSISVQYLEETPEPQAALTRTAQAVEINGTTYSRAELDDAARQSKAAPLPDLESAYVPEQVSAERSFTEMAGSPIAAQRDQLTKLANDWLAKAMAESAGYDESTGAFIPKRPNDPDSMNRLRVAVLNLRQLRAEFEYLSGQSQRAHGQPANVAQLTDHDREMLRKAEANGCAIKEK